jgi:hypothetical protein
MLRKIRASLIKQWLFGTSVCRKTGAGGINTVEKQDLIAPLLGQTMKEGTTKLPKKSFGAIS